ncbi:hypothetical protein PCASD_08125 [Puccinia coronata f. sp. avenae]|uniref:Uncharacterized protein n=1 Tax=Puccinia coronata f. sp. avenae TaxID=200324 RepID=A0A2N5VAJ1_9BASI|nr:hypothetical protein PCASD_08125 [Puccinia coronata f. sp. avenae]
MRATEFRLSSIKVALVISVLQDQLAKHEALMRSWAGNVLDLWKTLYGLLPESHPWFQLVNDLPLPPVVGEPNPEDMSDSTNRNANEEVNEEEEPESNVEGDEVDSALMESMLNVAINDVGNSNGQVGNGGNCGVQSYIT